MEEEVPYKATRVVGTIIAVISVILILSVLGFAVRMIYDSWWGFAGAVAVIVMEVGQMITYAKSNRKDRSI